MSQTTTEETTKPLLTVSEVAEVCRVSTRTVRRWIERGEMAAHRLGRQVRISEKDLKIFLRERWSG